jgi:serine/threonine protein kinase
MRKTLSIAEDPSKVIKFGQTKFSDYTKVCILGKGTYGEVTRCIHIASGIEVAMKTFFFEVINSSLNFSLECI